MRVSCQFTVHYVCPIVIIDSGHYKKNTTKYGCFSITLLFALFNPYNKREIQQKTAEYPPTNAGHLAGMSPTPLKTRLRECVQIWKALCQVYIWDPVKYSYKAPAMFSL